MFTVHEHGLNLLSKRILCTHLLNVKCRGYAHMDGVEFSKKVFYVNVCLVCVGYVCVLTDKNTNTDLSSFEEALKCLCALC